MKRIIVITLLLIATNCYADRATIDNVPNTEDDGLVLINENFRRLNDTIAGIVDTDTDVKVKVSANDSTAGYLNGKLVAGSGITLTETGDGSNESLVVASSANNSTLFPVAGTFNYINGSNSYVYITAVAGGGGGGSGGGSAGGGGAGGQGSIKRIYSVSAGETCVVVVGAAGVGGDGSGPVNFDGTAGGNTTFDGSITLLGGGGGTKNGGGGGLANSSSISGVNANIGNPAFNGGNGGISGGGGASIFAYGGAAGVSDGDGVAGTFGSGGGGGAVNLGGEEPSGANGGAGFVLVEW